MHITAIERTVDTWLAAYCEPGPAPRMDAIRQVWAPQGHLADPPFEARGFQGISDQAAALLTQFPAHRFERSSAVEAHHSFARYEWRLLNPQLTAVVEGLDVIELDVDGRINRVVGFFGAKPPILQASSPR